MSFASRQLSRLQANSSRWANRSAELRQQQEEEEEEEQTTTTVTNNDDDENRETKRSKKDGVSDTIGSSVDAPIDVSGELVSDASAAEEAALAAMFPERYGIKPKIDVQSQHAARARTAAMPITSSKVKIEGAPTPSSASNTFHSTIKPKKAAVPIAPAALLGGVYDSSDDDDDDHAGSNGAGSAASSASNAAAGASTAAAVAMSTEDEEDEDSDDDEENHDTRHPLLRTLPISHEVELRSNGHTKSVSALCLDKSGGRVLSGGYDYQCKMWDFGGMNESMSAFRTFEPQEGHQVRQLVYSNSGDMFLVVTGGAQPKIYTREAVEVCTFARGDMYILDQKLTKGHSTPVTSGWWHPTDRNGCITSGIDGTVRLWDINDTNKNLNVVKLRGVVRGISVTATSFTPDGKMIVAGCSDGTLHLLKQSKGVDYRDTTVLPNAHPKGSEISSILCSHDGFSVFTRGGGDMDSSLKQWDLRAMRQPVHILEGLPSTYPETNLCFGANEKIILTGMSERIGGKVRGAGVFIDRMAMKPLTKVSFGDTDGGGGVGVVRSCWHDDINQVLFGCSDGTIRLLYDPLQSKKGALMCLGRKMKPKSQTDFTETIGHILTPHALPSMRGESHNRKRQRDKTAASLAPEAPVSGKVGVGGRPAGSQSMAAYHLSKYVSMREDPRAKDPREALLAMDELAKKDPVFFGKAYQATQPVTILAEVPEEERQVKLTQEEINLANKKQGQI